MKLALPSRANQIDDHFGHCAYFTVFTIENNQITSEEIIESPAGCGCKSNIAQVLAEKGVSLMLAGNMGEGAVQVLQNFGIQVIRGCSGELRTIAERYLSGDLTDSGAACHAHAHGHECGHH